MTTVPIADKAPAIARFSAVGPVPLYHQIEVELRNLIFSGQLAAGSLLPTEPQLCGPRELLSTTS